MSKSPKLEIQNLTVAQFINFAQGLTVQDIVIDNKNGLTFTYAIYYSLGFKYGGKVVSLSIEIDKINTKLKPQKITENGPSTVKCSLMTDGDEKSFTTALIRVNNLILDAFNLIWKNGVKKGFVQTIKEDESTPGEGVQLDKPLIWICLPNHKAKDSITGKFNTDKLRYGGEVRYAYKSKGTVSIKTERSPTFARLSEIWGRRAEIKTNIKFDNISYLKSSATFRTTIALNTFRPLFVSPVAAQEYEEDKKYEKELLKMESLKLVDEEYGDEQDQDSNPTNFQADASNVNNVHDKNDL